MLEREDGVSILALAAEKHLLCPRGSTLARLNPCRPEPLTTHRQPRHKH